MEEDSVSEKEPLLKKRTGRESITEIPSRHLHNAVTSYHTNKLPEGCHRYHDKDQQQQQQQQQEQQQQTPAASAQGFQNSRTHEDANISNTTALLRNAHHHYEHQEHIHQHHSPDSHQEDDASSSTSPNNVLHYTTSDHEGKKRMAMITLVSILASCAGILHTSVLVQYVYQIYTDDVYGNESDGVHVSEEPCLNSSDDSRNQEVLDKSSDLLMRLDMVAGGIGLFVNIFLGSYSDSLGRRFLLLVPIVGHFLRNASAPIIIHWDLGLPALYVGYALDGLCGGYSGILLGLYVYTADITQSDHQRTLGMAVVETALGLSIALTNLAAGYFIEDIGFFYPFLVSSILLLITAIIVLVGLPETVSRDRKRCSSPVQNIRRVLGIFGSQAEAHHQTLLLLGLFAFFIGTFPMFPDIKLRPLYLMDHPFCWNSIKIGIFMCAKDGGSRLVSLVLIKLLRPCVLTPFLAMIGMVSLVGSDILMALAPNDIVMYMVPVINMASGMTSPALRAMMSRMVPPDRQGALFAAVAVVESFCYCFSQLTFLSVYQATVSIFNGLVYFVIGAFHVLTVVCLIIYVCVLRRVVPSMVQPVSVQADEPLAS